MCDQCKAEGVGLKRGLDRRRALALGAGLAAACFTGSFPARADSVGIAPPKPQNVLSAEQALARLMEGNARYVAGVSKRQDFSVERKALVAGQNPFAGVLSCADSRVALELAFDTGLGDLFVCRVAGNFVDPENIASFEYAVDVLKTPLIMVLGHEGCGAVKATISAVVDKVTLPGHLPELVTAIGPAVEAVANQPGDILVNATRENVRRNVEILKAATPILSAAVNEGRLQVVGGLYRLTTGQVELLA